MLYNTTCYIETLNITAIFVDFVTLENKLFAIVLLDDGTVSVFDHQLIKFTDFHS